jgi:NADH:ubiquinone oxidoreductase subunit 4 (subunit M)
MYTRRTEKKISMDPYIMAVVVVALVVVIGLGIYPQPLISLATLASKSIIP